MVKSNFFKIILLALLYVLVINCAAPKSVIHSGKVTPYKHFKINSSLSIAMPTATVTSLTGEIEDIISDMIINSSDNSGEPVAQLIGNGFIESQEALAMQGIDPVAMSVTIGGRYGIHKKIDLGFAINGGSKALDMKYQFIGSTKTIKDPSDNKFYGSIGIQYSSLTYELPSLLGKLQSLFKFEFKRKDFLIPLVFSNSFGKEEKYGSISYGLAYNITMYEYAFDKSVSNLFYFAGEKVLPLDKIPEQKGLIHAYGPFFNIKVGYKYAYLRFGVTSYYQNYGSFKLIGGQSKNFSGLTIVPNFGVEIAL